MKEYNELTDEIYELEQKNLSYEAIDRFLHIRKKAYIVYLNYLKYGIDSFDKYSILEKRLDATIYNKIKAIAPQFSKEVIDKIISGLYSGFITFVNDILVVDDNVVITGKPVNSFSNKLGTFLVNNNFVEVTSGKFTKYFKKSSEEINLIANFLSISISNFLKTRVNNYDDKLCLAFEDNEFLYNVPLLSIYVDKDFSQINHDVKDLSESKLKVLVKYNDADVCFFEIKIHGNQWIVKDNPDSIWKLSENLPEEKQLVLAK